MPNEAPPAKAGGFLRNKESFSPLRFATGMRYSWAKAHGMTHGSNNKSKSIVIFVRFLRTWREKSVGLIGTKHIVPVSFSTRWGIHTFGVLQPIDIIILDRNSAVIQFKESLQPNRLYFWNPIYTIVIELPAGTIRKKQISVHNHIRLHQRTIIH